MDNTSYFLGDTIWFAAYTRQTNTDAPSKVSGVLYAELYNNDGYLVERKLIEMKEGRGNGFFALTQDIMYSGFYELRAYTRWQLNWGLYEHKHSQAASEWFLSKAFERDFYRDYDKLYSRVFPVYDKPTDQENPERNMTARIMRRYFKKDMDEEERKPVLTLFPEGGNLVADIPNRIAFEAKWNDGEQLEGTLKVSNEEVPALNRGRGVFTITPEKGMEQEVTFTTKDGQKVSAKLPKPEEQGVAMNVRQEGDEWVISTRAVGLSSDSLAVTVMHEGRLQKAYEFNSTYRLEAFQLEAGIHQVTVFDAQGRVWADRLFFVTKPELTEPTLTVSGMKDEYKPYEKIELQVAATSPLPPREGAGDGLISLSVRDGYQQDQLFDNGNIMTEMLLASEIKGFIPNPGWYFEKDDEEHRQALDLLMMTQGWRRFVWKDMAVKGEWDLTQPNEAAPIITGEVARNSIRGVRSPGKNNEDADDNVVKETGPKDWITRDGKTRPRREVKVHAELVHPLYKRAKVNEAETKEGQFRIQLPHYYGNAIFFLAASDTTKWGKDKEHQWVKLLGDEIDEEFLRLSKEEGYKEPSKLQDLVLFFPDWVHSYLDPPEYFVKVAFPYPRFVKPFDYYQCNLSDIPDSTSAKGTVQVDDDTRRLREIKVNARYGGQRKFDDSQPAYIIDAEEAQNLAEDAGIGIWGGRRAQGYNSGIVRALMGDYGLDIPYIDIDRITNPNSRNDNILYSYGLTRGQRIRRSMEAPEDSIYTSEYLKSVGKGFRPAHDDMRDLTPSHIENLVIYSDYCPRMEGSKRYSGGNLPETRVVQYPYADGSRRVQYRDRRYVLPGFAYPAEFYQPDYSKRKLPDDFKDYRRTLYWNPSLRLDESGRATVSFYNNSRPGQFSVSAQGITKNGLILTNEE
ncbi:MAG: hypothetical protein IJR87_06275 [Bacteroidaceae bacterium]|nr:hypothetical protein [Bacteroidaceae bacterium]